MEKSIIFAVDFDGTCVDHQYPNVGEDVPNAVTVLLGLVLGGHKIILYTMRSGPYLEEAVKWFDSHGIPLWGVNNNPEQHKWSASPKVFAHRYIDDAALGCPIVFQEKGRPYVDWSRIGVMLSEFIEF